jgi:hypothetical protein
MIVLQTLILGVQKPLEGEARVSQTTPFKNV